MQLKDLIKALEEVQIVGKTDMEIKEIKTDSSMVTSDSLFICLKGRDYDGHAFIKQVEEYGAVAVITEKKLDTPITQIIVKNSRIAMSKLAAKFYDYPDKKLKLIGVVGTNGKTSTSHIIKYLVEKGGKKCGVIGTLGIYYGNHYEESKLTTPDPLDLHGILAKMYDDGVKIVVMEVSAHAIQLEKLNDVAFEIGVFTNFSQDHLDFFENMDNYRRVKKSFFDKRCRYIVSNSDDELGLEIVRDNRGTLSYGIENPSDVFAINLKEKQAGTAFVLNLFDCIYNVNLKLKGNFNVYNALAGATAAALIGVNLDKIAENLSKIEMISGRLELVYQGLFSVYVDYAHTPDGLEKAIKALRPTCSGKLICVFGCGGNRDIGKRKLMGRISGELADFSVLTSDNPRFEEPMDIINEIEEGFLSVSKNYVIVQERSEGIIYALKMAKQGDIVLIAGKGSERYQEILGIKHLYNDKDTVNEILRNELS